MKKIKFLLLSIVWFLSFSCFSYASSCESTWSVQSLIDNVIIFSWEKSWNPNTRYELFNYWDYWEWTYCLKFTTSWNARDLNMWFAVSNWTPSNTYTMYSNQYWNWVCLYWNKPAFKYSIRSSSTTFHFDVFRLTDLFSQSFCTSYSCDWGGSSPVDCSQDSNYLQCLESLNTANWTISSLSWSLASCQSDLSSCQWGADAAYLQCLEDKESCQTSLNSLSWQYLSCVNYNSSLSDQLNECLQNSSSTWEELICNTYSLNRYNWNDTYSSQIHNDLRLPRGYKWYLDEGVLWIKNIYDPDNAYSLDWEEFEKVVNSYGILFLFLFSGGLFVLFLYLIRKYFTSLFK